MTFAERLNAYEKLMRLDKPIGILLLLWPTLWGLWLSSFGFPNPYVFVIFVLGVVLMRSAGCVMNDVADRRFDGQVARTKDRPLATGAVATGEALALAALLALLAFGLVWQLNALTVKLSVVALALAVIYPFLKRFFWLPQAWLGIAFGFGIPMAFASHHNHVAPIAWLMLAANVFWAVAYDTEYAMVDREDDLKLGLKSSAILFGHYDVTAVMVCQAVFLGLMLAVGMWARLGIFYMQGLVAAVFLVVLQYRLIRGREPAQCFKAFLQNNLVGAAIYGGLLLDFLLRVPLF
jgi:4-hydroxybenzoate polyprenyltransferase